MREFLAKDKMTVIPHPSYSQDLALCDFILSQKFKVALKDKRFSMIQENCGTRLLSSDNAPVEMLRTVALSLGSLYKFPRRLL
jgi:hypothetical protein